MGDGHLPSPTPLLVPADKSKNQRGRTSKDTSRGRPKECYTCGSTDHLYKDCR